MYSVYCHKCFRGPCRMLDVLINNDEFQAVVVDDKNMAVTSVKRKGCSQVVSIGIYDVINKKLIDPHKSILMQKPPDNSETA